MEPIDVDWVHRDPIVQCRLHLMWHMEWEHQCLVPAPTFGQALLHTSKQPQGHSQQQQQASGKPVTCAMSPTLRAQAPLQAIVDVDQAALFNTAAHFP